jgi:hypothetical protein
VAQAQASQGFSRFSRFGIGAIFFIKLLTISFLLKLNPSLPPKKRGIPLFLKEG